MPPAPLDLLPLLKESNALLEGHFLLSSGLHSAHYVQCAQLLQHPGHAETSGKALAGLTEPGDVVVSPAMGGIIIGQEVARALKLRHIFCEREEGLMVLRRGFSLQRGERVILVEDVFTTGKSTREVMAVVLEHGAQVCCALSLIFRGAGDLALGVPTHSLCTLPLTAFAAESCPLCKAGLPLVKPGSRRAPGALHG